MRQRFPMVLLAAAALLASAASQALAREHALAGVRLGRSMQTVALLYGDPTRSQAGALTGGGGGGQGGQQAGTQGGGQGGGMMGMGGGGQGGGMMGMGGGGQGGGVMGMGGGGQGGGMMGMGGGGQGGTTGGGQGAAATASPLAPQKYAGLIASLAPEDFLARVLAVPTNPLEGSEMSAALGTGGAGGGQGGMMGMGGGQGGMGGGGANTNIDWPATTWIYERPIDGATFVFGFDEEGRVNLISVGDDKPYSISKGGRRRPFAGARTSRGIALGDTFKKVILTYGYPEQTEVLGAEVLLKYFERHGVAFTFRQQNVRELRVTSITIKSPED